MVEYKRNPNTNCTICDKSIYRRPADLKKSAGRSFCGQKCYGKFCRKETPCVVCGTLILASEHKKTCSRSCANTNRAGISYNINRPRDKVVSQRSLKIRLMKARGEKCERCGFGKVQILHVHHKDRNREHNNLSNLELICPNCHAEEHYLEGSWLNKK